MLQPPAGFKSSQNGSDVKPDMAWLQRRPIGSPGGGAAVEPSVRQVRSSHRHIIDSRF